MKFYYYDWLVVLAVILLWGAHGTTNYVIMLLQSSAETVEQAEAVVKAAEAAPVARMALQSKQLAFIFSTILTPAFIFGVYAWFRRREKMIPYASEHIAWMFLFVAATDFLNDISILLGVLS